MDDISERAGRKFVELIKSADDVYHSEPVKVGTAYEKGCWIVVCGEPNDTEDENSPDYHNCDAMGCGWEHVLYRFHKP